MLDSTTSLPHRLARFSLRVVQRFRKNNGILLASAVGYNFALSMVPMFALALIVLSHVLSEEQLIEILGTLIRLLVPGEAESTRSTLVSLFAQQERVGLISLGAMILFSALAFRMLEGAMLTIFRRHRPTERRKFLVSAIMPFAFSLAIMLALVTVTTLISMLDIHGDALNLPGPTALLSVAAYLGLVGVFFAFYRLMPIGKISSSRALAGGFVAGTLWALVQRFMQWYFASISLVGVLYGSLSTVVVILLSMEVAAVIVLLGAQVIAELEVSAAAGVPWHEEPKPAPAAPH